MMTLDGKPRRGRCRWGDGVNEADVHRRHHDSIMSQQVALTVSPAPTLQGFQTPLSAVGTLLHGH